MARLRGQAGVCKFTISCTGCREELDYTDAMLRNMLCRHLRDLDIRVDLLSDKNQDISLEKIFKFAEAKGVGKCLLHISWHTNRSTLKYHIPLQQDGVSEVGLQGAINQGHG